MKKYKYIGQMICYNFKTLICFEFIFKLLSFLIFTPMFFKCFDLIMNIVGYKYLVLENIGSFFSNPLTIFLLILLALFMMVYAMFDITTIIIILDASYHSKKIKVTSAIRISLDKCKNMFHLKNIMIAMMTLFIIPFLNIGVTSSLISTIRIPEFVLSFILKNKMLLILFLVIILFLVFLLLKWLYSFHYYVLENIDYKEARKRSVELSKKHHLKDLFVLIFIQIGSFLLFFFFVIFGIMIIIFMNKVLGNILLLKSIITTIIWIFIVISLFLFLLLSTPISYAGISSLYYLRKKEKREKAKVLKIIKNKNNTRKDNVLKKIFILFYILSFIGGVIFTYGIYKGKYNLNIESMHRVEITAHRGASLLYPENTMSAFIGAKALGADWIELDVHETKDGEIVVIHDSNLKRTTGVDKKTWKVNYEEIKDLDAGSFFSESYKEEKIPLLKDVILWAKENNMKLNIEIKPTGHEKNLEESVIRLMKETDCLDFCVITSQHYEVLEKVKEIDKDIETVYVMSLFYGSVEEFSKADHFSLEASLVTKSLVNKIHNEGKQLYVWTINTKEEMEKMISFHVDNIVTDNVALAKDTIYANKTSNLINEYIRMIESIF